MNVSKPIPSSRPRRVPATRQHRQRVIEQTREEILHAAARLLARNGPNPVSLQEIAAEIGLTAPALYAYFESKQAIFAALLQLLDREVAAMFSARPAPATPFRRRLTALVRRHLDLSDRQREVVQAIFSLHATGEASPAKARQPTAHFADLVAWFRRESGPGDLGTSHVDEAACVLNGLVHGFFFRWLADGARGVLADESERIVELFYGGVSGHLNPSVNPRRRAVRNSR